MSEYLTIIELNSTHFVVRNKKHTNNYHFYIRLIDGRSQNLLIKLPLAFGSGFKHG